MRRRLATAVGTSVLAFSILAGCGSGGSSSAPASATTTQSSNDAAVAYVDKVCAASSSFAGVSDKAPKLDSSSPEQLKAAMATYMGELAGAFTKSATDLKNVGTSPVAGGDEVVTKMADTFTQLGTTFTDAKTKVEHADANDPSGGMQVAGESLAKLSDLADPLKSVKSVPELSKAAERAPKCQHMAALGDGGSPSVSPTS
jgi:hypothetical protein